MSEFRADPREERSYSFTSPFQRIGRGLRAFVADVQVGMRDPVIPPSTPTLGEYPIRRPLDPCIFIRSSHEDCAGDGLVFGD